MSNVYITKEGRSTGHPYWRVCIYKHHREPVTLKIENFDLGFRSGEGYDDNNIFCDENGFNYKTAVFSSMRNLDFYELYVSSLTTNHDMIEELKQMVIDRFYEIIEFNISSKEKEIEKNRKDLIEIENLKDCSIFLNRTRDSKLDQILNECEIDLGEGIKKIQKLFVD